MKFGKLGIMPPSYGWRACSPSTGLISESVRHNGIVAETSGHLPGQNRIFSYNWAQSVDCIVMVQGRIRTSTKQVVWQQTVWRQRRNKGRVTDSGSRHPSGPLAQDRSQMRPRELYRVHLCLTAAGLQLQNAAQATYASARHVQPVQASSFVGRLDFVVGRLDFVVGRLDFVVGRIDFVVRRLESVGYVFSQDILKRATRLSHDGV